MYTVQQAIQRAEQLPHCKGFTFQGPVAQAQCYPVQCYFKSSLEGNADPNWQKFERHHGHYAQRAQVQQSPTETGGFEVGHAVRAKYHDVSPAFV
jgi:hypothetical protein